MSEYDVIVIGAGPGGYVAAIRCAQLGLTVACVDDWVNPKGEPSLGGTCLNVGCIPSKALLDSSHHYSQLINDYGKHGINVSGASVDIPVMLQRKNNIVTSLTNGISALFVKNKVQWVKGKASIAGENRVNVTLLENGGSEELTGSHIIIATGSVPTSPEGITIDNKNIVDSTGALEFAEVPERLCVLGGGVIGLELGSVWSRLGSETTVLVRSENFLKSIEPQIARAAKRELVRQGLIIKTSAKVTNIDTTAKIVKVTYEDAEGEQTVEFDKLLVATGRKPNTDGLNLTSIGVELDERGFIKVNKQCQTDAQNVYAVGDVVRGPMLAHKASEEGVAVAESIAGQHTEVNFLTVPWVIYTWPEIAWVGYTTEQLKEMNRPYNEGVFPFMGNGRALAQGDPHGMVKIISDKETDTLLGIHVFGPSASELIGEAVVAMEFNASAEDLARTIHAHPTLSEAMHEAALAVDKRSIHM